LKDGCFWANLLVVCAPRPPCPLSPDWGTLAGGLGCFPFDDGTWLPPSVSRARRPGIRRLVRVGKRQAPLPIRDATSGAGGPRPYLNTFRGEPAISRFAWHFTSTHRSSLPFVTDTGAGLHARVPRASPCPWVAHLVSGRIDATDSPFRTRFPCGCGGGCLNLATPIHSSAHSTKGTPSPGHSLAPTGWRHTVSGSVSLPSTGCFSPFPHGTGSLSVAGCIEPWTVVRPASGPISRVGPYSRNAFTPPAAASPTGLSPAMATRSSGLRLRPREQRGGCRPLQRVRPTPVWQRRQATDTRRVWAWPRSLAATEGILFLPRGTQMFHFPRCPSRSRGMTRHDPRRVAPFGDPGIAGCQRLPRAFRGVAASFLGTQRQGIHRVPIITGGRPTSRPRSHPGRVCPLAPCLGRGVVCAGWSPNARLSRCGGAAGVRTPNLRRARAALSRLSYDPGGRAWTRTRDLGLIRAAL
jgi:hypothetical protein